MPLRDNYLELTKKFGGPYGLIKKGISRGIIGSILKGRDISISRAYEISKVLGVTLEELYPGGPQAERISEHPECYVETGLKPVCTKPVCTEEQRYIGLLTDILRGKNQKNARAIKENLEAFHYSKDMLSSFDIKANDCPDAPLKKTAEHGK